MRISTSQKRVQKIVSEVAIVQAWSTLHNKTRVLWGIHKKEVCQSEGDTTVNNVPSSVYRRTTYDIRWRI